MLRLIAWISLIIGPIALLVFFQLQFLPYHDEAVSWWQRIAVVVDLVLLWMLWPLSRAARTTWLGWRDFRRCKIAGLLLLSVLPVLLVFTVATFPGEWLDARIPAMPFVAPEWTRTNCWWPARSMRSAAAEQPVVEPAGAAGHRRARAREIRHRNENREPSDDISLRGRRLEGAMLSGAYLPKADFTGAQLQGALAHSAAASGRIARSEAQLQGASLDDAQLQGASLDRARLQGASLDRAQLQGAYAR